MAIGFISAADNAGANNSFSFDATGSNYLIAALTVDGAGNADPISAATYNGTGMALLGKITGVTNVTGANTPMYMFGLANPTTGSNTLAITNAVGSCYATAACYSGVASAGQPDAFTSDNSIGHVSTYTVSITTVANNAWTVWYERDSLGATQTAGTGSTGPRGTPTFAGIRLFDSGAPITPAGSYSMSTSFTGTDIFVSTMVSLSPAGAVTASGASEMLLRGVT